MKDTERKYKAATKRMLKAILLHQKRFGIFGVLQVIKLWLNERLP